MAFKKALVLIIIFHLLLSISQSYSQVIISGKVFDSSGVSMPSIAVSLNRVDGLILAYSISDSVGKYIIKAKTQYGTDSLFVTINAMGFRKESVLISKNIQTINFRLIDDISYLPIIIVNSNQPLVRLKKDTIEYDVKGFSNQQDRVIGDIIKKLPGIEVNDDGRILFQGKPISELYIDGDNLFSGNYNVATNNIPVDFVSKVQVLENYQEIKAIKNTNFKNQPALNLVLSDKARIRISGKGDISLGAPDLYDVNLQNQLFKKSIKFINLFKLNNIGNDLKNDIISHSQNDLGQNAIGPLISLSTLNPPLEDKRDLFNNSGLLDVNGLYKLSKDLQLNINTNYLANSFDQTNKLSRTIYLPGDTIKYYENQNALTRENMMQAKIALTSNKSDLYFKNSMQFESLQKKNEYNLLAVPGGENAQFLNSNSIKFSNDLRAIKMLGKKFAMEGRSYISINSNPVNLNVQPSQLESIFPSSQPFKGLEQTMNTPSTYIENYLSATIPGKVIQSYKIGFINEVTNMNSQLQKVLNNGSISPIDDSVQNKLKWNLQQFYFEPKLAFHSDRFQTDLALKMQQTFVNYEDKNISNFLILPSINAKLLLGKEDYMLFNSSFSNNYGNVQNVFPNYVMMDYRTLSKNSGILPQRKLSTNSLIYNYRETLKLLFISIGITYSTKNNNTILDYQYSASTISATNRPLSNSNNNIALLASLSKYLFPLRTTFSVNLSVSRAIENQYQNNELIEYQNVVKQMRFKINSKLSEKVNLSYDGVFNFLTNSPLINNSAQKAASQFGQNYLQKCDVNYSTNEYNSFKVGGEYYYSKLPSNTANNLLFMDIGWTFRSKSGKNDLTVSISNILNETKYKQVALNSNITEVHDYNIRPSSLIIKYLFRL